MSAMEITNDIKIPIYGLDIPDWLNSFFQSHAGIFVELIQSSELLQICENKTIKYLVIYENFLLHNKDAVLNLLEQGRIESLIIYNDHPFVITDLLMDQLDKIAETHNINMIVDGYYDKIYKNIKFFHIDTWEHVISHSFTLLLSQILKKNRQHTKTFLMQTVFKDNFRKTIGEFIINSSLYKDFIKFPITDSNTLYKKTKDFFKHMEQKYGAGLYIDALKSFGNGLPNFKIYEQVFCEIVLETRNQGNWHFTEKTFRPISLGVPMVYLGHKPMYNRLVEYGYHLYDNNFYHKWHKDIKLEEKLPYLEEFLLHINSSELAQKQMEQTAQHNYQHFWNHRKLHFYTHINHTFESIFGRNNLIHNIYKEMNF